MNFDVKNSTFSVRPDKHTTEEISNLNGEVVIIYNSTTRQYLKYDEDLERYVTFAVGDNPAIDSLIDDVDVDNVPIRTSTGYGNSGIRKLSNGNLLAPPGFEVESGSIAFGDNVTLHEANSFLRISNAQFPTVNFDVIDARSRRTAASNRPRQYFLTEAQNEFTLSDTETNTITSTSFSFTYRATLDAQTNVIRFKVPSGETCTNIRARVRYRDAPQATIKYLPTKEAWITGEGGLDFFAGENDIDLGASAFRTFTDDNILIEVVGDTVNLLGSAPITTETPQGVLAAQGFPYLKVMLQRAEFREIAYSSEITAGGSHPIIVTRDTPTLTALGNVADASEGQNSGFWLVANDQIAATESNVDSSIMIRALSAGLLDANGTAIPTTATAKSGIVLAAGTQVRVFSSTDLRVVSTRQVDTSARRYPDTPIQGGSPLSLTGQSHLYTIYRNRTLVLQDSTGVFEVRLFSLMNAVDRGFLNYSDVFGFRNDSPNDATFRIRTFQTQTVFSSNNNLTIDLPPGHALYISPTLWPGNGPAVWEVLEIGQSTTINLENIYQSDWYRDDVNATAIQNNVRVHRVVKLAQAAVYDFVLPQSSTTQNPIILYFRNRNNTDSIAWIEFWSAFNSNVPPLGADLPSIIGNIDTSLAYITNNINSGFDFTFPAPNSIIGVSDIAHVSGNTVRLTLSGSIPQHLTLNHDIEVSAATNTVHNGTFAVTQVGPGNVIHVTNVNVTDSSTDEPSSTAHIDIPIYARATFINHVDRRVNLALYSDNARLQLLSANEVNDNWFAPGSQIISDFSDPNYNADESALNIVYNTSVEITENSLVVADETNDFHPVLGGSRKSNHYFENTTAAGNYNLDRTLPLNYESIHIRTDGAAFFAFPILPQDLPMGESRLYTVFAHPDNDADDTNIVFGHRIGGTIADFDDGFNAYNILPGDRAIFEIYNTSETNNGIKLIHSFKKTVKSGTIYDSGSTAVASNVAPLPVNVSNIDQDQNEDASNYFFGYGANSELTLKRKLKYEFDLNMLLRFEGSQPSTAATIKATIVPIINGSDALDLAEPIQIHCLSNAEAFETKGRLFLTHFANPNDTIQFDLRFGTFPPGYSVNDITIQYFTFELAASHN